MLEDDDFTLLNALYLKKMATAETIVEITGLAAGAVHDRLNSAEASGWVVQTPSGALLLEDGTRAVLETYRTAYAGLRATPELLHWYERFETLNTQFIARLSEWQLTSGDERLEDRVLRSVEQLAREIGALVPRIPRYAAYIDRFERGLERVDAGQRDYVCKPTVDSVHNIWFEFHEDILAVLGRPRDTA